MERPQCYCVDRALQVKVTRMFTPVYEKIQIVDLCMYFNSIYDTSYIL